MKLAIVTDAWRPQVNGVVTTLSYTRECLQSRGHEVTVFSPDRYRTLPCPTYPEIRLAVLPERRLSRELAAAAPDAIHIATEGPVGMAARRFCLRRSLRFTTSFHTQFPEYLRRRAPVPVAWTYAWLRRYHSAACRTMVATEHQRQTLISHGFRNLVTWSRGVDTRLFRPCGRAHLELPRPIWMYAGRVAVEKNLDAFLGATLEGSKVVVGGGPDAARLAAQYPAVHFAGYQFGEDLVRHLSCADVFVFPSRTDTYGLVMLEAMACGTPVAAYPVTGPLDVVDDGYSGCLDEDLVKACLGALRLPRGNCRSAALRRTWERATGQFLLELAPARSSATRFSGAVPP